MQISRSGNSVSPEEKGSETRENAGKVSASAHDGFAGDDLVLDISGRSLELSLLGEDNESVEGLYFYKNAVNLIPKSLGRLTRLRKLKYFANEINVFPAEFGNLVDLEYLQLKISSPGLSGLPFHKLKALKELDLSNAPPRSTVLPVLSNISGLKCLTKLSVCHFSIRYLPPDIGSLNNLESLDLSFNKLRSLPVEIGYLNALISLKVASNKLVELPASLSSLQSLELLDLSKNRLTSLGCFDPVSMHKLQILNLQCNRLHSCRRIPPWIQCNLDGNGRDMSTDDYTDSSVEMDVFESSGQEIDGCLSYSGSPKASSRHLNGSPSRRFVKEPKQRFCMQQRARQERLNTSRKLRPEANVETSTRMVAEKCEPCSLAAVSCESHEETVSSGIAGRCDGSCHNHSGEAASETTPSCGDTDGISCFSDEIIHKNGSCGQNCSCTALNDEQSTTNKTEVSKTATKSKRHSDKDLDNPKPSKFQRPTSDQSKLSCKYNYLSFCSAEDHLSDGFYDAGRDRPYMPLKCYEQKVHLDSREVILLDRSKDEELDAIALSAQALVYQWRKFSGLKMEREQDGVDNLRTASLLALFVSDNFGGSDRNSIVDRTRKAVSGSNYLKPFVCSCSTGNSRNTSGRQELNHVDDVVLQDLCERSLRTIKARQNSVVVPLGSLHFGVCRHRALLMKYLCDRLEPPVPCELVRGYLDFLPHAWNVVITKKGDSWVRMVVDACRPHDIREETDPEYFCRYVPLSRLDVPLSIGSDNALDDSFLSLSTDDEFEKSPSRSVLCCKFGSVEVAAKVRTLDACETAMEEIKNFEYSCLGEIRIMGALKNHPCIIEILGHQISSKWGPSIDGNPNHRILQSVILMEYIKGGSLKSYIDELSKNGMKRLPVDLSLYIARDVACALSELHSKHIIHRDIKGANVLMDLNEKSDGSPVVKLCDFDRAVPVRSSLHTCCIGHVGIPSPDACVGTPRWMAPEVLRTMHERQPYGVEVDIWSFGCLVLELLTLEVPFTGLPESEIHHLLQKGKRPPLTEELESLRSLEVEPMADLESVKFLVDVFWQCTEGSPCDRPTAEGLYEMLSTRCSVASCGSGWVS